MKKTISLIAITILSLSLLLAGCSGAEKDSSEGGLTAQDVANATMDDVSLSDDDMKASLESYAALLEANFAERKISVIFDFKEDGSVSLKTERPELDADGNETGDVRVSDDLDSWPSVKDAFGFYFNAGTFDKDGNLLVSLEDLKGEEPTLNSTPPEGFSVEDVPSVPADSSVVQESQTE